MSKSYGGGGTLGLSDAQRTKTIWDAFGQYIAKELRGGRGVWVPKFGQFSFTGMHVDLAVSINSPILSEINIIHPPIGVHKSTCS